MTPEKYISDRLENQINWFSAKSAFHKRKFQFYQKLEFGLGMSIPVLIALSFSEFLKQQIIFGEISGANAVAFLAMIGATVLALIIKKIQLEAHQEFWLKYRENASRLQKELNLYNTGNQPYDEKENAFAKLVENTENILNEINMAYNN